MCIRDSTWTILILGGITAAMLSIMPRMWVYLRRQRRVAETVSYTHLRAHETVLDLVCRLLLEKKQHANIISEQIASPKA